MDSGCLEEGESLDEEYDTARDLLPEEVLGIIDQLLCLEVKFRPAPATCRLSANTASRWLGISGILCRRPF